MDLVESVRESRREGLEALRDLLAGRLLEVEADKTAPLAKQLAETMRELDGLKVPSASTVDDLAKARAARRAAGASGS